MKTQKEQEKLRELGKTAKKLMRELFSKNLYPSSTKFSDKENVFVVTIGNIPQTFEGYPIILKPGTVVCAKNRG